MVCSAIIWLDGKTIYGENKSLPEALAVPNMGVVRLQIGERI